METEKNFFGQSPEQLTIEKENMGHVKRYLNVLVAPKKVFEDVDKSPKLLIPMFVVLFLTIIISLFSFDTQVALVQESMINGLVDSGQTIPADGLEGLSKVMTGVGIFFAGIVQILMVLVVVAVIRGIATFLDGEGSFKRLFSMYLYASVITILGLGVVQLVSVGLNVSNFNLSLAAFLPETAPPSLSLLLQSFGVFNIWYLAVVSIGISVVERLSMAKSVACALVPQLISMGIGLMFLK